jgi:hypothetical protein
VEPEPRIAKTLRVVLDDGTSIRVTEDQPVYRRDGTIVALDAGLSLLPLYVAPTKLGYPMYKQISDYWRRAPAPTDRRRIRPVARMVYEWRAGHLIPQGMLIRHIDGDRTNCEPENLRLRGKPDYRSRCRGKKLLDLLRAINQLRFPNNHRVVAVQDYGEEEVFDLDTESYGCFNIGVGGIFLPTA